MGIPVEKQALLFTPFSQMDASTTRVYGGTGLGLSIVRNLAKLMDGDVGVQSEEVKGTRIWFRVRASHVATADGQQTERDVAASVPVKPHSDLARLVLVAEDDPVNRIVIEAMLKKYGISFASVENGQQALLRVTADAAPDLVLMDCQMPVMDGYEATRRIRQWEKERGKRPLPIVALTASAFEEDRNHCLAAGMDDFLTKPLDMEMLKAALDNWLSVSPERPRQLAGMD
jgi:CheY-like chemotaxis protein